MRKVQSVQLRPEEMANFLIDWLTAQALAACTKQQGRCARMRACMGRLQGPVRSGWLTC